MQRTSREEYLVHTQSSSSYTNTVKTHFWFEVLEGEDQGTKVAVPSHEFKYDNPEVANTISALTGGELVSAVLERETEDDPWKPVEIEIKIQDFKSHY